MIRISAHLKTSLSLVCALGMVSPWSRAQAPQNLPNAPSRVLEDTVKQEEALSRTAGSGAVFKAASTFPGPGNIPVEQASDTPLPLSLDDAIAYGLERNVRLKYDAANQREVHGLTSTLLSSLIPNISFNGSTGTQEINLAALGFKPQLVGSLASQFGIDLSNFSTIVKVNVTQAQLKVDQTLFNMPDIELYRAAKSEKAVVDLNYLNSRGNVVTAVADAYLKVLADQANLTNAQEQERASKLTWEQADARHTAGVGTNLDRLRADVDYKQRQQSTIAQQTALAEDTIQLNRIMGLPAGQPLELTDTAPFAELAAMPLEEAKRTAYAHRKDILSLEAQIDVEQREYHAVKYQRLPTLAFSGYYGVLGETTGMYHGVFNAVGSLKFPIFREAAQRGEQEGISAQLLALRQREASLRTDIEAQIRSAALDVQAAHDLVQVAQSNVKLAQQELSDERDRFKAGVDDNLPVLDAQATLTGAQAQLVTALYQYNVAKLNLARNTGVVETRYRTYLGK